MRSTRRTHGAQALTLSLVVLLVIGMLGSMTSVGTVAARAAQGDCTELNLLTWEGYADDSWLVPFQEQYGVTVNPTYIGSGDEELAKIKAGGFVGRFDRAAEIFTEMSTRDEFAEFLTLPLYEEI